MSRYHILLADSGKTEGCAYIPYLFRQAHCDVTVYAPRNSWTLKNIFWNRWVNPAESISFSKGLVDLVSRNNFNWIVLGDDWTIREVNEKIPDDTLIEKIVPISNMSNRKLLGSKAGLSVLCTEHEITTPPYLIFNGTFQPDLVKEKVSYPLLLKVDKSAGGVGIVFCHNQDEVKHALAKMTDIEKKNLVFQKYIAGDNIAVEALYRKGKLYGYSVAKVLENMGNEFAVSMDRLYFACPEIEKTLIKIGEKFSIDGFNSITFMRGKNDGLYYLVETDLRPHIWFYLARHAGVDFSHAIENVLNEKKEVVRQQSAPTRVLHAKRILTRALERGDMFEIGRWITNKDNRLQFLPWNDPRMILATYGYLAQLSANKIYNHEKMGSARQWYRTIKKWTLEYIFKTKK
jgi:predicted ATP-grasp superfamily ATP-dependent carboligase